MADISSLKEALSVSPDNLPLLLLLGQAYLDDFQLTEAKDTFDRALSVDSGNPVARTLIAQILDLEGRSSEAILRLDQLAVDHPGFGPAWILRAKFALNENDPSFARDCYERAIRIDNSLADSELLKRIREAGGNASRRGKAAASHSSQELLGEDAYGGGFEEEDYENDPFEEVTDDLEFEENSEMDFSRAGGMESVKEDIRMKILYPMQNPELFEAYGKKAGGGVLLYGPPGCGKTLISRATAGEIDAKFLSVGLHQILDMWIGKSEEKLHEVFEMTRKNTPAVLFFDEVDALAADRKDMRSSAGRTLINQFLSELDSESGKNDGVLVLGATNAPWHLDSAFLRPGRFDRLVFVPPPDLEARAEIIRIMADGKPISGLDPVALARKLDGFSGADIKAVFDQAVEASLAKAMKTGKIVPISQKQLIRSAKKVQPSTKKWFESARNYALYANQSGFYDPILKYLGIEK